MIDKITIFVPHILMALMIWALVRREDLDDDPALPNRRPSLLGRVRRPGQPKDGGGRTGVPDA